MTIDPPSLPPCARYRHLTGVEDDDSTGSSLRWFVCRLCGHRWSVAPKKARSRSKVSDDPEMGGIGAGLLRGPYPTAVARRR
jgi:hypothetical protein